MNPHSKTITRLRPKYAVMPLAQSLVLILLGMPSHAGTTPLSPTVAPTAVNENGRIDGYESLGRSCAITR